MKKIFALLIVSVMMIFSTVSVSAAKSPIAPVIDDDDDNKREPNKRPDRPSQNNPNNNWCNGMGYNPNYYYPNGNGGYYLVGSGGTLGGTLGGGTGSTVYLTADESWSSPKTGSADFTPCLMAAFAFVAVFSSVKLAKTIKFSK